METFYVETDRLKLYAPHPKFCEELNAVILDSFDTLHPCVIFAQHRPTLEDTRKSLERKYAAFVDKNEFPMIIYLKSENKIIGMCETDDTYPLLLFDGRIPYEIGYWLHKSYVGYGYATEATNGLIKHVNEKNNVKLFSIYCSMDNLRSNKVAQRLNFKFVGAKEVPANPNYKRSDWPDKELCNVYILEI